MLGTVRRERADVVAPVGVPRLERGRDEDRAPEAGDTGEHDQGDPSGSAFTHDAKR
jgi:hypothetical protein